MNTRCPRCQTSLAATLQPQHVGHRTRCGTCQAALVVAPTGFTLADEPAAAPRPAVLGALTQALPWLVLTRDVAVRAAFAVGAVVVILMLFAPSIDQARVLARQVDVEVNEAELKRLEEDAKAESSEEKRQAEAARDGLRKERRRLQQGLNTVRAEAARGAWWYQQWMRLGFLLLAVGALGQLRADQPAARVVGAVVLVALLVLAFNSFAHFGIRFELAPTGPPD